MKIGSAGVKVMRSYDYCHFEVCLGVSEPVTLEEVDALRKDAQRLADKAVEQYKIAKEDVNRCLDSKFKVERLRREVQVIVENYPKSEWTPEQQARVKALEDLVFALSRQYDYEDEWDRPEDY